MLCRKLAGFGERACREGFGIEPFPEVHRDIHTFTRRAGRLPEQREEDAVDFRPLLHRDGSVLSAVTLQVLPDLARSSVLLCEAFYGVQHLDNFRGRGFHL